MIELRHIGIYVTCLEKMEEFYQNVFSMKVIISKVATSDSLIDALVGKGSTVYVSKLVTPHGVQTGTGDMVELLCVDGGSKAKPEHKGVYAPGTMHMGFGVCDMEKTVELIQRYGGRQEIEILQMGNNRCCFCTDPENNWLELIERNNATKS